MYYAMLGGKIQESTFKVFATRRERTDFLRSNIKFSPIDSREAALLVPLHEAAKRAGDRV